MISTKTTASRVHGALFTLATALALAGCASSPTRFYTLSAPQAAVPAQAQNARLFIEVSPIALPERLARPQLVVRSSGANAGARVDILEQERWSSPFNNELRDALASGLANRLGATDVSRSGRPTDQPVYRIAIELREFDAAPGDKVQATYSWSITRSDNAKTGACRLTVSEPVAAGIDALVLGVQRTVADAVNAIAANVNTFKSGATPACQG
ncbi:membrane integrity-associated transporter subunit PqiC [Collimonas humicola]|uniref:PqiC family protein n=1 Tax=Collimonas humicola TaxID=2825886 RepID=UPI001B8D7036|nr:PqiC family protein [Collimonas humicola]